MQTNIITPIYRLSLHVYVLFSPLPQSKPLYQWQLYILRCLLTTLSDYCSENIYKSNKGLLQIVFLDACYQSQKIKLRIFSPPHGN